MAINLDEINTAAVKHLMPGLVDNFFKNSPLLAYIKKNRYEIWTGGPQIQENIVYTAGNGAPYAKGGQFDLTKHQVMTGLLFSPKFYYQNVTEYTEDIEVLVRGPQAILSLVQAHLGVAALGISAMLAIDIYHHGQVGADADRSLALNGLEEALTDGVNATWAGNVFGSYGQQTRADVAPALASPLGLISSPSNAAFSYRLLEHSYQSCVIGDEHPVIGITTNRGMGFINEQFQPIQRIEDKIEPVIGWAGIKFKQATIIEDQYCPGQDGINDPRLGNYATSQTPPSGPPAPASVTPGELFWWLNPGGEGDKALLRLYIAASQKFQFGFTGFKVAQDSTAVSGQVLFAGNGPIVRAPRLMRNLYGMLK